MPLPGRLNLTIYQGDSFDRDFLVEEVVDGDQIPVDFTTHVIRAFIRSHSASPQVIAAFFIEWPTDGEDTEIKDMGKFNASLTSAETSKLPKNCVYDIQSIDIISGKSKTWVYGNLRVIREVTRG
jgi:hypothetical protein